LVWGLGRRWPSCGQFIDSLHCEHAALETVLGANGSCLLGTILGFINEDESSKFLSRFSPKMIPIQRNSRREASTRLLLYIGSLPVGLHVFQFMLFY
jgi:hypothetical protein